MPAMGADAMGAEASEGSNGTALTGGKKNATHSVLRRLHVARARLPMQIYEVSRYLYSTFCQKI
jgi:hypothetical protein